MWGGASGTHCARNKGCFALALLRTTLHLACRLINLFAAQVAWTDVTRCVRAIALKLLCRKSVTFACPCEPADKSASQLAGTLCFAFVLEYSTRRVRGIAAPSNLCANACEPIQSLMYQFASRAIVMLWRHIVCYCCTAPVGVQARMPWRRMIRGRASTTSACCVG